MWPRDDVDAHKLADTAGRRGTRIGRSLYRGDIAPYDRGNESRSDLFITDKLHICRFYHCVGCLDHCYEAFTFDHS
jgi:hypothetical protein